MIEITADTACMLYVGTLILLLISVWLFHSHKARNKEIVTLTTIHTTCEYCSYSYITESVTPFHRCPHCHCLNQLKKP